MTTTIQWTLAGARLIAAAPGVLVAVGQVHDVLRSGRPAPADLDRAAELPPVPAAEHLASRVLLRALLDVVTGEPGATIAHDPMSRPFLTGRPDVGISLSHSDGLVAAAVAPGRPVGVDVQAPTPASPALLARCCTPTGRAVLTALPDAERDLAFARLWVVQEACVKADGTGLAGRPWRVPVEPGERTGTWCGYRWVTLHDAAGAPAACAFGPERR